MVDIDIDHDDDLEVVVAADGDRGCDDGVVVVVVLDHAESVAVELGECASYFGEGE